MTYRTEAELMIRRMNGEQRSIALMLIADENNRCVVCGGTGEIAETDGKGGEDSMVRCMECGGVGLNASARETLYSDKCIRDIVDYLKKEDG